MVVVFPFWVIEKVPPLKIAALMSPNWLVALAVTCGRANEVTFRLKVPLTARDETEAVSTVVSEEETLKLPNDKEERKTSKADLMLVNFVLKSA